MTEEEVDLLVSGLEDNQGQINYEGICVCITDQCYSYCIVIYHCMCGSG